MPAYTKAEAETELVQWKAALKAIQAHRSYTMPDGRTMAFRDIDEVLRVVEYFGAIIDRAARGNRLPTYYAVPLDC